MKILAFLQCQWFKNPARMKQIYAKHGNTPEKRAELNSTYLFMGCVTGRNLTLGLTDEICDMIVWEEISKEIGDRPPAKFPPDPEHIRFTIDHFKPDLILALGKLAAVAGRYAGDIPVVYGPHPAARQDAVRGLIQVKLEILRRLEAKKIVEDAHV